MKNTFTFLFALFLSVVSLDCVVGASNNDPAEEVADVGAKDILGNPEYLAFSYGGYRGATRDTVPDVDQLKEDMRILSAMGVKLIRTYNTQQFKQVDHLLEAIDQLQKEDPEFRMYVMLGAWIDCDKAWTEDADHLAENEANNAAEISAAVALANRYPRSVKMIAVGNEAMVHWATSYFVQPGVILKWVSHLQDLKKNGKLPTDVWITSSDNFAAWGGDAPAYHKPDLKKLIQTVDFISMHTYPFHDTHYDSDFWVVPESERQLSAKEKADAAVERAIDRAKAQYENVASYMASVGADKPIHIGETGWSSVCSTLYGAKGSQAADEYKAKKFYELMRTWTNENHISCFYFEAFDEKWKDSGNAAGSENHFGMIDIEGHAKYAIWDLVDSGAFKGLTRGGKSIAKTYGGDEKALLAELLPVPEATNWDGTVLNETNQDRELGVSVSEKTYIAFHKSMTPEKAKDATLPSAPVKLNVWEGTCELELVDNELHLKTGTGAWWGCGLEVQSDVAGENLSQFKGGVIQFEVRGETRSRFYAGFQTGRYSVGNQTNNGILFGPGEKFELTPQWKTWKVPVSELLKADKKANLKDVTSLFFLKGEKEFDGKSLQLRNVLFFVE